MADLPTPTDIIPFNNSLAEQPVSSDQYEALPGAKDLMENYLFGIPFEDDNGNDVKPKMINHHINVAKSIFEQKFDQPLTPRRFVEPHDYKIQDWDKFGYTQLFHFPVLSVDQVQLQYIRNQTMIDLPTAWIRVYNAVGQIQIVPTTASISQFVINGNGNMPLIFGARSYFPSLIYVNYVAGFDTDKIPYSIVHWLCLQAAKHLLAIAGDLVLGPGVANTSIGLGGLSQSIGTTKSNKGAFSGRIEQYEKDLEELSKDIRRFYKSIKLTTV